MVVPKQSAVLGLVRLPTADAFSCGQFNAIVR
jgi:hypothetical protein